jgi:hypothetical protein
LKGSKGVREEKAVIDQFFVSVGCFDQIQIGDVLKALCESGHG